MQLSAISYQLSAFSFQLSAISYQLSAFGFRLLPASPSASGGQSGNRVLADR